MSQPKYIIHGNALHSRFVHRSLVGYRKDDAVPTVSTIPTVQWTGKPIPIALWREVLAFFKWSYDTTKSEVQVRLFHNFDTGEWRAWAFPQEKGSGLTTNEIEDHPNREEDMRQFHGFTAWGTVHHHCALSAFQSGTDKSDEESQAGLHITVGHMDKSEHDLHSRVSVILPGELDAKGNCTREAQKLFLEPDLLAWFELPEPLRAVPAAIQRLAIKHYLISRATDDETFPQRWKDNLIEKPKPTLRINSSAPGRGRHQLGLNFPITHSHNPAKSNGDPLHRANGDFTDAEMNEMWERYFAGTESHS